MWHPWRFEELQFLTPVPIGECRARLRALLHETPDLKGFFLPSLEPERRPLEGSVSTFAFVVRKYTGASRRWKLEARGALRPLAHGTLVHVWLGEPIETLFGMIVMLPLFASILVVMLFVAVHQVRAGGDWRAVLPAVLLAPLVVAIVFVIIALQRVRGRGDRAFLRHVLAEALAAPREI